MRRTVRLRPVAAVAGLALALTGSMLAGLTLAAPWSAAAAPAPTAAPTGTPTTTPTGTSSTSVRPPVGTPSTVLCPTFTSPAAWPNGVGPSWTFEDGTTGGWATSGSGVALAVTTQAAASGTHSLRLDGVTPAAGAWVSPTGLPAVAWYKVTARVRAATAATAYVQLGVTTTDPAGVRPMTRRVTSSGWTDLTTYFRPDQRYPDGTCGGLGWVPGVARITLTSAAVNCPDAPTGPVSLLVDDVAVTSYSSSAQPPPTSTDQIPTCSTPPGSSPPTTSAMQCTASYQVVSQWQGGHQANLTVRNVTAQTLHPWTLQIVFPDDQQIFSLWGAGSWAQAGAAVTVGEGSWGQPIPPGGSASIGLVRAGTARPPTSVALNGMPCILSGAG